MNSRNKYIVIFLLFLFIIGMIVGINFKIKLFMVEYENCKDDFRVIDYCGCLPFEGNYTYFEDQNNLEKEGSVPLA